MPAIVAAMGWKTLLVLIAANGCLPGGEWLVGVSPRNGRDGPAELARWEGRADAPAGWIGREADLIGLSLGGAANWGSLAEYGVNHLEDECGWKEFSNKDRMEIAVPLFPGNQPVGAELWSRALSNAVMNPDAGGGNDYTRWQNGSGHYLDYFRHLAEILVRHGYGNSILRLGWEFNGDWFPWGTAVGSFGHDGESYSHARAYRELFASVRDAMMAVAGAEFRWSWCVSIGGQGFVDEAGDPVDYTPWFPGVGKVDFVSVDVFDDEPRFYPGRAVDPVVKLRLAWLSHLLRFEGQEVSLAMLLETLGADLGGKYPWAARDFIDEQLAILADSPFANYEECRRFVVDRKLATPGRPGVQWFRDFADEKGCGFLISEWGVWENDRFESPQTHFTGDDNPEYIRLVARWLRENPPTDHPGGIIYFEEYNDLSRPGERDGFNHSLLTGKRFPLAREAYVDEIAKGLRKP